MAREYRPRASSELVSGYAETADLAERRAERMEALGEEAEAKAWTQMARYCREMAEYQSRDDDQHPAQVSRLRHRREQPLPELTVDFLAKGGLIVSGPGEEERPPLNRWQEAVLELALGYLTSMQRVCFEMIVGGGLTAPEVARAVGGNPAEIRSHLSRARKTLAERVSPRLQLVFHPPQPPEEAQAEKESALAR